MSDLPVRIREELVGDRVALQALLPRGVHFSLAEGRKHLPNLQGEHC